MKKTKKAITFILILAALFLVACGKPEEVSRVERFIDNIGTVTLDSGTIILEAEREYDLLSKENQAKVGNYSTLSQARSAYDSLTIKAVENQIDSIGPVTIGSEAQIAKAEQMYDNFNLKDRVQNYDVLKAARESYDRIIKVYDMINNIGSITYNSEKSIIAAEKEYNLLSDSEKRALTNYNILIEARSKYNALPKEIKLTKQNVMTYFDIDCELNASSYTKTIVTPNHTTDAVFTVTANLTKNVSKINSVSITVRVNYIIKRAGYNDVNESEQVLIKINAVSGSGFASFNKSHTLVEKIGGPSLPAPTFVIDSIEIVNVSGSIYCP